MARRVKSTFLCYHGGKIQKQQDGLSLAKKEEDKVLFKTTILFELSVADDLDAFKFVLEHKGFDIDEPCYLVWKKIGSKMMRFEERTPLMINYFNVIQIGFVHV